MKSQEHVADIIHTTKEEEYTDFINRIGEDDPELATFFEIQVMKIRYEIQ